MVVSSVDVKRRVVGFAVWLNFPELRLKVASKGSEST